MKKIISFALLIMLLLPCMPMSIFADDLDFDNDDEIRNVALDEDALAYSSSQKNSLWTPPKSIKDGKNSSNDWHGWECAYPTVANGANTSNGFSGEYCGIRFSNHKYFEISEININLGLHAVGKQNTKYTIEFLIEGEWVEVATFYDSDAQPKNYANYEEAMAKDISNYHIPADITIKLETPRTTNNVRISISEFAKNYPGGDVLMFPYIYEVELMGKRGETPELELPEGAYASTNISYTSVVSASSSASAKYPFLSIDGNSKTAWSPKNASAGEYLMVTFSKTHTVNKVVLDFGTYIEGTKFEDYSFDIEAFDGEKFVKIAEGNAFDSENKILVTEYDVTPIETNKVRIVFKGEINKAPEVYEFEVHISDEKTYFLESRVDTYKLASLAKGNLAVLGEAYSERSLEPYSDNNYINDGKKYDGAYVWFPGTLQVPVYCGVKLDNKYTVNKVALYVQTPAKEGTDIMRFEIQAFVDGEYVTVATGKSYDKNMKYTTVYEFDPVVTDDIRIVFTAGGGTIVNVKELEIYAEEGVHPMFDGAVQTEKAPEVIKDTQIQSLDDTNTEIDTSVQSMKVEIKSIPVTYVLAGTLCGVIFDKKRKNNKNGKR